MNRYLTEFVGTFFLVLTIGFCVLGGAPWAPLAIGSSLMVMVYMGGHISGAHYNPAVSLAVMLRGTFSRREFAPYVVAQLAGAIAASVVVRLVTGNTWCPRPEPREWISGPLLVETLYTTALALVVLNVTTVPATAGNSFYGLAIGFTFGAAAFAGSALSGGAFNPAVGLGPAIVHAAFGAWKITHVWIYVVGPCAGGALAAAIFRIQHSPTPSKPTTAPARS